MTRKRKTDARKQRKLKELEQLKDVKAVKHKELEQIKGAGGGLMEIITNVVIKKKN